MKLLLEDAYPRIWKKGTKISSCRGLPNKVTCLQDYIVRIGSTPHSSIRHSPLREKVLNALPVNTPFTIRDIATKTKLEYEVVGRFISNSLDLGFNIYRVGKQKPAIYLYQPSSEVDNKI